MNQHQTVKSTPLKIQTLARTAEWLSIGGVIIFTGLIGYVLYLSLTDTAALDAWLQEDLPQSMPVTITPTTRFIATLLGMTTILITLYALYHARELFSAFQKGDVLTTTIANKMRHIGWAVFAIGPIAILENTLFILALTALNEEGKRSLSITVRDTDIAIIIFGLLLVMIGHILHEAALINEDNKSIV